MSILICKNIETEGPGTIEDYLKTKGMPYTMVELKKGEGLPDPAGFDTLILMGGPMSVNEEKIYPYLKDEEDLVRKFISSRKKVLGICLGAQIMVKALGARVYKGEKEEAGWLDINLTDEGLNDPCVKSLARDPETGDLLEKFKVFHWHGETFDLPEKAVRLAGSELYLNQAFRYGDNAYGFQFHIEVNKEMVYDWFEGTPLYSDKLREETEKFYDACHTRAVQFYEKFFN